jgi:hypothetical protein
VRVSRKGFADRPTPLQPDHLGFKPAQGKKAKGGNMLWTICAVLIVLWLLGMVTSYTFGGFIHILLVLAVVTVLIRVIQGRRIVS